MRDLAYIGITGVKTFDESKRLAQLVRDLRLPLTHRLMVGGLASYKSLRLGYVSDPMQYVLPTELNRVLVQAPQVLNIVHYNSKIEGLRGQIADVLSVIHRAEGIQLNIPWPDPIILRAVKAELETTVILQVSTKASEQLDHDPVRIAAKLAEYEGLIDFALIDPSGGVGRGFEPKYAKDMLLTLVATELEIRWGIAGGLGPGRLSVLEPLLEIYPELSWDAQARLRKADRHSLDLGACEQYLREGIALIRKLPGRASTLL